MAVVILGVKGTEPWHITTYLYVVVNAIRPPFQGDSSEGRLPRAEAPGLFYFSPFGRLKMSKPAGSRIRSRLGLALLSSARHEVPWKASNRPVGYGMIERS